LAALEKSGISAERLSDDPALVDRLVKVIAALPPSVAGHPYREMPYREAEALPPDHYRIRVNRGSLPPMAKLEEQFSKGGVSCLFDGREWKRHASRMGANDVTAEEVIVHVHDFGRPIDSEEAIAWGLEHDYLPADEKETYAVGIDSQTRDLQKRNWLVGLGSFALGDGGLRRVAVLFAVDGRRILDDYWFDFGWRASYRFLFVRKSGT
jgi:hypothetical protein